VAKYAGIGDGTIKVLTDTPFTSPSFSVVELPEELQDKSISQLLDTTRIKDGSVVSKGKGGKLAVVSNHSMRCGISTYNENLCQTLLPKLDDYKLFIERNLNPTHSLNEFGSLVVPSDKIVECWERNKPLDELVAAIKDYDPDTVLIEHEWGLFPVARYWLSLMTQLSDYRVIVILHSIFPHHPDKTIVEASIPECVVHLDGAKTALENKGFASRITVIPHGCYTAEQSRLWNIYRSNHTFVQCGFALTYKNFQAAITATSILKQKYDDVFFTALLSETDFNKIEHHTYYKELLALVSNLNLENNVALIRGFKSDSVINCFMRTNQAALFPYSSQPNHEVFGASGSARLAMASGIPVITSSIHHFEDLPTIKADTPETIADALDNLFSNKETWKKQVEDQNLFIALNSWEETAKRYLALIND
jgi:glycosyltransferase involved in cell wall biosynthesis